MSNLIEYYKYNMDRYKEYSLEEEEKLDEGSNENPIGSVQIRDRTNQDQIQSGSPEISSVGNTNLNGGSSSSYL